MRRRVPIRGLRTAHGLRGANAAIATIGFVYKSSLNNFGWQCRLIGSLSTADHEC
jgi:hypothetical protein